MIERSFPYDMLIVAGVPIRDTLVVTWGLMILLIAVAFWVRRNLKDRPEALQNLLEATVEIIENMVKEIVPQGSGHLIPFIGTLCVFLVVANSVCLIPGIESPTRDLSTDAALALIVFVATPVYGVWMSGPRAYFRIYIEPSWLLLPFNIIGELGRTVALAMRLFGNMLSGTLIVAILVVVVAPFLVPVPLQLLGLLIGIIQAYVFTLLATVYIAAGLQLEAPTDREGTENNQPSGGTDRER